MTKCLHIDATAKTITVTDYVDFNDLNRLVNGGIAYHASFPNGDAVMVDDDGLYKPQTGWFMLEGDNQPLAGNGVIVGRDKYSKSPDGELIEEAGDVASTPEEMAKLIRFVDRAFVDSWARANASDPALTIIDRNGTTVHDTMGRLFGAVPPAPKK